MAIGGGAAALLMFVDFTCGMEEAAMVKAGADADEVMAESSTEGAEALAEGVTEGAVVFEFVAEGAAADDVEAVFAKFILGFAVGGCLEEDYSVFVSVADPIQIVAPVVSEVQHLPHDVAGFRVGGVDSYFVACSLEP